MLSESSDLFKSCVNPFKIFHKGKGLEVGHMALQLYFWINLKTGLVYFISFIYSKVTFEEYYYGLVTNSPSSCQGV